MKQSNTIQIPTNNVPLNLPSEDINFKIDSKKISEFEILAPSDTHSNFKKLNNDRTRKMDRLKESYNNGFRDNFKCQKDGQYGDVSSRCIVFYKCMWSGTAWEKKFKQICPEGTAFNEAYGICDWTYKFRCK